MIGNDNLSLASIEITRQPQLYTERGNQQSQLQHLERSTG